MKELTLEELNEFKKRAKIELKSGCDCSRLRWDDVVEALCNEVIRLKVQCKEILTSGYLRMEQPSNYQRPTVVELPADSKSPLKEIRVYGPHKHKPNNLSA